MENENHGHLGMFGGGRAGLPPVGGPKEEESKCQMTMPYNY